MTTYDRWTPHPNSVLAAILNEPGQPRLEAYNRWLDDGMGNTKAMDSTDHGLGVIHEVVGEQDFSTGDADGGVRDVGARNYKVRGELRMPPADRRNSPVRVRKVDMSTFRYPAMGLKGKVPSKTGRTTFKEETR